MVKTGLYYALVLAALGGAAAYWVHPAPGAVFGVLALFCLWFFRDPDREVPAGPVAVSPADGKVVLIRHKADASHISIFLNIFDVHVNRAPVAGKIVDVQYKPGRFMVASKAEASLQNEMNTITIDGDHTLITFSQIAGLIARRIICYKKPGDFVTAGERVGLIQFGSRVDIALGREWEVAVREGQRVWGGSSILARRRDR